MHCKPEDAEKSVRMAVELYGDIRHLPASNRVAIAEILLSFCLRKRVTPSASYEKLVIIAMETLLHAPSELPFHEMETDGK
jgi:hypothetical protein